MVKSDIRLYLNLVVLDNTFVIYHNFSPFRCRVQFICVKRHAFLATVGLLKIVTTNYYTAVRSLKLLGGGGVRPSVRVTPGAGQDYLSIYYFAVIFAVLASALYLKQPRSSFLGYNATGSIPNMQ